MNLMIPPNGHYLTAPKGQLLEVPIIEYSKMIIEFTKGMNYEQFEKDKKTQLAGYNKMY